MEDQPSTSTEPAVAREAMLRRVHNQLDTNGQITLPAIPSMIDDYCSMCHTIFTAVGVRFDPDAAARFRHALEAELSNAYETSTHSRIVISYYSPVGTVLDYHIESCYPERQRGNDDAGAGHDPQSFGAEPDARVWLLAAQITEPAVCPVLDIGAGTGRNALALARRGHPVDAVEAAPALASRLRTRAEQDSLNLRVIAADAFAESADLRYDYQLIVLSAVVPLFQTAQQLRDTFALASEHLAPGGRLVFDGFLTRTGYVRDAAAWEFGQYCATAIFTPDDLQRATAGLPIELVDNCSAYDFEQTHLPEGTFPPASWFPAWAAGHDVFDLSREESPIELRWLVYRKSD